MNYPQSSLKMNTDENGLTGRRVAEHGGAIGDGRSGIPSLGRELKRLSIILRVGDITNLARSFSPLYMSHHPPSVNANYEQQFGVLPDCCGGVHWKLISNGRRHNSVFSGEKQHLDGRGRQGGECGR